MFFSRSRQLRFCIYLCYGALTAMSSVIGRFAPSPSGRMHLGNIFSALIAWSAAKSEGGKSFFVLKILILVLKIHIQLSSHGRSSVGAHGMRALFQSDRKELYLDALTKLKSKDLLPMLFCSRADLHAATAPHA